MYSLWDGTDGVFSVKTCWGEVLHGCWANCGVLYAMNGSAIEWRVGDFVMVAPEEKENA